VTIIVTSVIEMDEELEKIRKNKLEKMMNNLKQKNKEVLKMDATDYDFKEKVLEKSKDLPVVVDFWASWCMPCRILGPIIEKVAKDYEGKFVLAKVNVDEAPSTSQTYGIRGIPSVKMFKDGEVVDEFTGAMPEEKIKNWIESNL